MRYQAAPRPDARLTWGSPWPNAHENNTALHRVVTNRFPVRRAPCPVGHSQWLARAADGLSSAVVGLQGWDGGPRTPGWRGVAGLPGRARGRGPVRSGGCGPPCGRGGRRVPAPGT
ncbi:hypothetical protein FKN01_23605 [Streptomyces sp. 130]|nr:hypothetical protein FKN01_23605 [Streptomyces sp. 130]